MIDSAVILAVFGLWVCALWAIQLFSEPIRRCCEDSETRIVYETTVEVPQMEKEESNIELVDVQKCSENDNVELITEHTFPIARIVDLHDRKLKHVQME